MDTIHAITQGFANTYVVNGRDGVMVVDPGSRGAALAVVDYCTNVLGVPPQESIKLIAMTHYHIDHIGGIATLLEHCAPDTVVVASEYVRDYMAGKRKLSAMHNWTSCLQTASCCLRIDVPPVFHSYDSLAGVPGLEKLCIPVAQDRFQFSGIRFSSSIGFGDWLLLPTPGHTEDSISFFDPATKSFICGDFILNVEPVLFPDGMINDFCSDHALIWESLKRLVDSVYVAALYPGHGAAVVMQHPGSGKSILLGVGGTSISSQIEMALM